MSSRTPFQTKLAKALRDKYEVDNEDIKDAFDNNQEFIQIAEAQGADVIRTATIVAETENFVSKDDLDDFDDLALEEKAEQLLDLDAVERRLREWEMATAEPWHPYFTQHGDPMVVTDLARAHFTVIANVSTSPNDYGRANCELIAAEHNALPSFIHAARLVHRQARECTYCSGRGAYRIIDQAPNVWVNRPCHRCAPARAALAAIVGEQ